MTPKVERTHGGMPDWALLGVGRDAEGKLRTYWPYRSTIDGSPFLVRFIVFRCPWAAIEATRIHMDDSSRPDPHDHSRTFRSWKFGKYTEWVFYDKEDLTKKRRVAHRRFGIHRLRSTEAHTITWVSPKLFTILFSGRQVQTSNYWTDHGLETIGMAADQEWA